MLKHIQLKIFRDFLAFFVLAMDPILKKYSLFNALVVSFRLKIMFLPSIESIGNRKIGIQAIRFCVHICYMVRSLDLSRFCILSDLDTTKAKSLYSYCWFLWRSCLQPGLIIIISSTVQLQKHFLFALQDCIFSLGISQYIQSDKQ